MGNAGWNRPQSGKPSAPVKKPTRMKGICAALIIVIGAVAAFLFCSSPSTEKREKVETAVDDVRKRFGYGVVRAASLQGDLLLADNTSGGDSGYLNDDDLYLYVSKTKRATATLVGELTYGANSVGIRYSSNIKAEAIFRDAMKDYFMPPEAMNERAPVRFQ